MVLMMELKKIVASFNDKKSNILNQENKGIWRLKETYNKALNNSNGDIFIAILEGDDFWQDIS